MTTLLATRPGTLTENQIADAKRQDILRLLPAMRPWSRTSGGELHGPCPRCGGKDRMICWPNHPRGPRALCRQCAPQAMDTIGLAQWLGRAATFPETVRYLIGDALPPRPPPLPPPPPAAPVPYAPPAPPRREVAYYRYMDFAGVLLYEKVRVEPGTEGRTKTFRLRCPRPGIVAPRDECPGDWYKGHNNQPARPYNLLTAWDAPDGVPILWVDGERDVETARAAGLIAVCGPHGGESWQEEWGPLFCDHPAIIIPDLDPHRAGQAQAERAARLIAPYALSTKIVPVPAKDLSAWAAALAPQGAAHAC